MVWFFKSPPSPYGFSWEKSIWESRKNFLPQIFNNMSIEPYIYIYDNDDDDVMELRIHPKKWECNPGLWVAFIIRPLTPVTFGVAFPQKLTEIGRELGVCVGGRRMSKHKAKCAWGQGVRARLWFSCCCGQWGPGSREKRIFPKGSHPAL